MESAGEPGASRNIIPAQRPAQKHGELAEHFKNLGRFAVMQCLGVPEDDKLIIVTRQGRKRFNQLNPGPSEKSSNAGCNPLPNA